jgi:predicted outer membrane repeat protein
MPTATKAATQALQNTATYGGAVNSAGIVSLQRAAEAGTAAAGGVIRTYKLKGKK